MNDSPQATSSKRKACIIKVADENGLDEDYILVGEQARIALELYPPSQGWAIVVDASDKMGWFAATTELRKAFITSPHAGEAPNEFVQRMFGSWINVQFEAKLVNPDGKTVANASCTWSMRRTEFDDSQNFMVLSEWSKAETNARRRLYNVIGLGVEQLRLNPEYELHYMDPTAKTLAELKSERPDLTPVGDKTPAQPAHPQQGATGNASQSQSSQPSGGKKPVKGGKDDTSDKSGETALTKKEEAKLKNLQTQIKAIWQRRGVTDQVMPTTLKEASTLYKSLASNGGSVATH